MYCPKCAIENPDNSKFCRSCGSNLTNVLALVAGELQVKDGVIGKPDYADLWGEKIKRDLVKNIDIENNFPELYSTGLRNTILGAGFLLMGIFLKQIPPTDTFLWLLMLIPGFCLIASGVRRLVKAEEIKKIGSKSTQQPAISEGKSINSLPSNQTEYISPVASYTTKDLIVPSVTEETTKHLKHSSDG